jgi:hypothetical protein
MELGSSNPWGHQDTERSTVMTPDEIKTDAGLDSIEETERKRIAQEESVKEKVDAEGNKWKKVYWGGGAHFKNWLEQTQELADAMESEIEVEEIEASGLTCYEQGGEKLYRIWLKEVT